jgi:hypothetical protein
MGERVQPRPKLGRWTEDLDRLLGRNADAPARERMPLIRIFEELRTLGYEGGYDAVRRYARTWAKANASATASAFVPLTFSPGEAYQFDWSHDIVVMDGVTTTVKVAHIRLCHSRMMEKSESGIGSGARKASRSSRRRLSEVSRATEVVQTVARVFSEPVTAGSDQASAASRAALALSHEPFLLVCTYHLARAGFNKVNGLANQSRRAREPLLARCDNAPRCGCPTPIFSFCLCPCDVRSDERPVAGNLSLTEHSIWWISVGNLTLGSQ